MSGQNKEPPKYTPLPPTQQLGATPQGVGNMEELGRMESMEKGVWGAGSMGCCFVEFANDTCNEIGITSHGLNSKNGKQCEEKKSGWLRPICKLQLARKWLWNHHHLLNFLVDPQGSFKSCWT